MTPVNRIQQNLLAINERRLLNWLCPRMPMWMTPDRLTAIGFFGALCIAAGYALSTFNLGWLLLAIAGYCINWFGDSLDGSLARYRQIERPSYGYFLDHSVDALATTIFLTGLGLGPFVRMEAALFGLVGYLLLSIHSFIAARVVGEMRLSYLSGGPTELRLMLIAMTTAMFFIGPETVLGTRWSAFDLFAIIIGLILIVLFTLQTAATARQLRDAEK